MEVRANEVATLLDDFIRRVDEEGQTKTSLFYDNCPGRNKDRMVITVAYFALQSCSNLTDVAINYLLRGLTCMPVDSMPVPIERVLVHQTVYAPSEWKTVICMARRDPLPYEVWEHHPGHLVPSGRSRPLAAMGTYQQLFEGLDYCPATMPTTIHRQNGIQGVAPACRTRNQSKSGAF